MINEVPYDSTNSVNPWLMERNNNLAISDEQGNKLTAAYIWSKCGQDREDLVRYVFNYYRKRGFPYSGLSDSDLLKKFNKLKEKNPDDVVNEEGHIKNTSSLGNDIYKNFVWEKYFLVTGGATISVIEVFNDDELLLNVIKNRMGYCITKEDGEERPYIFSITDGMILQGIRSTGYGYNASLFKPVVAKYLYKHYAVEKVLDFSAGWGARALACMSLDLEYYGIDPLTFNEINNMMKFFGGKGRVVEGCSEDSSSYKDIPVVDCVMSCPPYFNLEIYSGEESQSINRYKEYQDWLNIYWSNTVINCLSRLKEDGYFIVVLKDQVKKYNLAEDMISICEKSGLKIKEQIYYKTLNSHLSGKKKSNKKQKNSEVVFIFCKK